VWTTAAVAAAIAVVFAAVLAVVAGARRTATAPDRYTASVGGNVDGLIEQRSGRPLTDRIAALPGVKNLSAYTFVFGGFADGQRNLPANLITFAGTRPLSSRVVAGRDLDPNDPHEFVADRSFVQATHARVGNRFSFKSISRAQTASGAGFNVEPHGAAFDAVLVGIIDSPDQINSGSLTVVTFPSALLREDVGFVATEMQVRLRSGYTYNDLRRQLDTLPGGSALSLEPGFVVSGDIRTAVDAQATGLWLLAAVLAVAALIALGQLLTRHVERADHERAALLSLGFTRRQRVIESLSVAAVPAVLGALAGALLAALPSGLFPTGLAREVEPHVGISVDGVALAATTGLLLLAVLTWAVVAIAYDERSRIRAASARRRRVRLAGGPSTAAAIGARFAMTRGDRRRPAYGTIAGLALIIALVAGASTFAASLGRLVTDRARFGQNYAFAIGDDGSNHTPAQLRAYAKDPDVAGLMILSEGSARVVDTTANIGLVSVERVKGDLAPRVLSGRLPDTSDEIMLGRVSAEDLARHVGGRVRLRGAEGTTTVHVVGIGIVPGVGGNDGVGKGGVVTSAGFARINGASETNIAAITLRGGAPANTARRLAGRVGSQAGQEDLPPVIANVERVRGVPTALAVLLGVLALLTMLHVMFMSIRTRRVDLAILKGLGANRRWITRVVHSQASLLAVVPLVIGLPLGVLAGARIFRSFVERIGALPDPTIPAAVIVGTAVGLLVLANLAAVLPARRARRVSTARLLRAE
jgi:hypothetical protein